jgi:adenine phosphoribosyltransferase
MPGQLISQDYELEYGTDTLEVQNLKINYGRVIVVDDVLATGGTAEAICKLINKLGPNYTSITVACLINIKFLKGEEVLRNLGIDVKTLIDVNA